MLCVDAATAMPKVDVAGAVIVVCATVSRTPHDRVVGAALADAPSPVVKYVV